MARVVETRFVEAARLGDIPEGGMTAVAAAGREILLARIDGNVYAASNLCPHLGGNLSMGRLEGTVVTCPRHRSRFDLRDGRVVRWTDWTGLKLAAARLFKSPRPLTTYRVRVDGDTVLVEV